MSWGASCPRGELSGGELSWYQLSGGELSGGELSGGRIVLEPQQMVLKYCYLNSNYTELCFLDASNAFDRINHFVLFKNLIKRGISGYIVRLFIFWYTVQKMYIRWQNVVSEGFRVTNGVRRGGGGS